LIFGRKDSDKGSPSGRATSNNHDEKRFSFATYEQWRDVNSIQVVESRCVQINERRPATIIKLNMQPIDQDRRVIATPRDGLWSFVSAQNLCGATNYRIGVHPDRMSNDSRINDNCRLRLLFVDENCRSTIDGGEQNNCAKREL